MLTASESTVRLLARGNYSEDVGFVQGFLDKSSRKIAGFHKWRSKPRTLCIPWGCHCESTSKRTPHSGNPPAGVDLEFSAFG